MYLDVCERDTSRYKQDTFKIHHDTTGYVSDRKSPPPNDRKPPVTPFTRAVGAYTQRLRIRTPGCVYAGGCVYGFTRVGWVRIRSGGIYAPGCVYAGRCVYANGGCVYTGGVYTHPLAYTQVSAYRRTPDCARYAGTSTNRNVRSDPAEALLFPLIMS